MLDAIEWKRAHPADDLLTALLVGRGRRRPPLARGARSTRCPAVHRRARDHRQPDRQRHVRAAAPPRRSSNGGATTRRSTPTRSTSCCATTRRCSSRAGSRRPSSSSAGRPSRRACSCCTCLASANRDPAEWGDDGQALDVDPAGCGATPGLRVGHPPLPRRRRWPASRAAWPWAPSSGASPGSSWPTDAPAWNGRLVLRGLDSLPVTLAEPSARNSCGRN